jgi:thiol-disulfide isomerase/thioredoxin
VIALDPLLVVCLCAEWCTACRAYRTVFDQAAADHPDLRFLWVDIEDSAALLDQVEVENFPTILIGEGATPYFFGTITPQRDVLQRLIAACRKHATSVEATPEISGLLSRLQSFAG